ncbi:predicted protein [Candida tropicalis MYA-3404]|uniref:Uncharacterized protein n=1 Tax=Candida tropicalis (strain ATCC MYA-3404 / T1) TaxID=294747 RepID=C5M981_CANTT|nr:predicted protein [Candida tropicalis MYA-3404]EER34134.1 predicted protein [Candida tropicalis MYA-3404]KAG4408000.1 hypothetical protein JTP64_003536 [Candida tropicalis]
MLLWKKTPLMSKSIQRRIKKTNQTKKKKKKKKKKKNQKWKKQAKSSMTNQLKSRSKLSKCLWANLLPQKSHQTQLQFHHSVPPDLHHFTNKKTTRLQIYQNINWNTISKITVIYWITFNLMI